MIDLKPCPFCGASMSFRGDDRGRWLECRDSDCYIHPKTNTYKGDGRVAKEWNTRHNATPDHEGLIEKLEAKWKPPGIGVGSPLVRLDEVLEIVRQHEPSQQTPPVCLHSEEDANKLTEIPLVDEQGLLPLMVAAAHDFDVDALGMSNLDRLMTEALVAIRPYLRTPEPVSLARCAKAAYGADAHQSPMNISEECAENIAKAVLNAAGVKYVD